MRRSILAALLAALMLVSVPALASDTSDPYYDSEYVGRSQTCITPSHDVEVRFRTKYATGYSGIKYGIVVGGSTNLYLGTFPNSGSTWKTSQLDTGQNYVKLDRVFANSTKSGVIVEFLGFVCE